MAMTVNRRAFATMSTADVLAEEAFAYWRELICATFVRLTAEPVGDGRFHGRVEHVACGDVELSTVVATSQTVRRTRALIGRDNEEYLLASILLDGRCLVEQDERVAALTPGAMAFYDSTRPYSLHADAPCGQLVVQVPKRALAIRDTRRLTARTLGVGTPGAVVSTFFTSLRDSAKDDATQTAVLAPHAVGLLATAAYFAADKEPSSRAAEALVRERVWDFLHRNFADPQLDSLAVARACNVSRRSLYRFVGDEGVAGQLRRIRIERATEMLLSDPGRPISAVATACGFGSDSGFHRAFRDATGQTPGDYRHTRSLR